MENSTVGSDTSYLHQPLRHQPLMWQVAAGIIGVFILSVSSRIDIPMVPVPMSMQTFAVLLTGAFYGWRLGTLTVLAWLLCGALGLPVFAGGSGGMARFYGPTAGYLIAFPIAAACAGVLVARGWNRNRPAWAMLAMLLGHVICMGLGSLWLANTIGAQAAFAKGVNPFLFGAVVKSALVVVALFILVRRAQ